MDHWLVSARFTSHLSLRFNSHFPGEPGLASVYGSKGWWRRWWWHITLIYSSKTEHTTQKQSMSCHQLEQDSKTLRTTRSCPEIYFLVVNVDEKWTKINHGNEEWHGGGITAGMWLKFTVVPCNEFRVDGIPSVVGTTSMAVPWEWDCLCLSGT